MAKANAVVEAAEVHADNVISAAQVLEAEAKRLREHAKAIRANTRTGRFYSAAEITNFEFHKRADVLNAAARAVALIPEAA